MLGVKGSPFSPFQPLLVACVPPRLAMACAQMLLAVDAGDPACVLDGHHALLEQPLATTGQHDRLSLRIRQRGVTLDDAQRVFFPFEVVERVGRLIRLALG